MPSAWDADLRANEPNCTTNYLIHLYTIKQTIRGGTNVVSHQ